MIKSDLSGFVVTIHSALCEQCERLCSHALSCIVTTKLSRTGLNPLIQVQNDRITLVCSCAKHFWTVSAKYPRFESSLALFTYSSTYSNTTSRDWGVIYPRSTCSEVLYIRCSSVLPVCCCQSTHIPPVLHEHIRLNSSGVYMEWSAWDVRITEGILDRWSRYKSQNILCYMACHIWHVILQREWPLKEKDSHFQQQFRVQCKLVRGFKKENGKVKVVSWGSIMYRSAILVA